MDTKQVIARFEAERQALALLDHPNIAHVFSAGTTDAGRPYFVMEYVKGVPITEHCDRYKLTIQERLKMFLAVCEAVQHAHQKAIIHRDIKPSNILVRYESEQAVPMIIDFGVAKTLTQPLTDRTLVTEQAQMIGTPEYMSPEQAEMSGQDIDTRTDIYSLGVLLYELLTGALPFDPKTLREGGPEQMRRMIREEEPKTPSARLSTIKKDESLNLAKKRRTDIRTLGHRLHGELDWITLKAMDKDRTHRYQTAHTLAEDVQRYLNQEPVLAGPPSTAYKVQKFFRRNKALVGSIVTIAAILVLATIVSLWQMWRANRAAKQEQFVSNELRIEKEHAVQAEELAVQAEEMARQRAYAAEMGIAYQALEQNSLNRARELLDLQRPETGQEDLRGFEWRYLWQQCRSDEIASFTKGVRASVAFSRDNRYLALSGFGPVIVQDLASGMKVTELPRGADCMAFSPRDDYLITATLGSLTVWDTKTWRPVGIPPGLRYPAAFSPDGQWLVAGTQNGFGVFDTSSWKHVASCSIQLEPGHSEGLYRAGDRAGRVYWWKRHALAFSPDSQLVVTPGPSDVSGLYELQVRRLPSLELQSPFQEPARYEKTAAFSRNGKYLLTGEGGGNVAVWDITEGTVAKRLSEHKSEVIGIVMSPDGKTFFMASLDSSIVMWDMSTWQPVTHLRGHLGQILALAMSPNGKLLASVSDDFTTKVWDTSIRTDIKEIEGAHCILGFTGDNRSLIAANQHGVLLYNVATGELTEVVLSGVPEIDFTQCWPAVHGTKKILAMGLPKGEPEALGLWDLVTGNQIATWSEFDQLVTATALSDDGQRVAAATQGGSFAVFDIATRHKISPIEDVDDKFPKLKCLAFSPDGRYLAMSGQGSRVWIWDLEERRITFRRGGHNDIVSLTFSPDGQLLAVVNNNLKITVWEIPSDEPEPQEVLGGHTAYVTQVAFTPDDKSLAVGLWNGIVKLRNRATWQEVAQFQVDGNLNTMAFSSDGRYLAVGYKDLEARRIQVLEVPSFEETDAYQRVASVSADDGTPHAMDDSSVTIPSYLLEGAQKSEYTADELQEVFEHSNNEVFLKWLCRQEVESAKKDRRVELIWEDIESARLDEALQRIIGLRSMPLRQDDHFSSRITRASKALAGAYCERATDARRGDPKYGEAIRYYEAALRADPNYASTLRSLAWLRATCPQADLRDVAKAVERATRACKVTGWKDHRYVAILAAVHATGGNYEKAMRWQKQAIDLLTEAEHSDWQVTYTYRRRLYQSGKPYRGANPWSTALGGLVVCWNFEHSDGEVVKDSSGSGLDGRLVGDAQIVDDQERMGKVLLLDGDLDWVDCGKDARFDIKPEITIICWIKVNRFDEPWQTIISKGDSAWRLARDKDTNELEFACSGISIPGNAWGGIPGRRNSNDGKWHHVAGVFDGARIYLYMDGVLDVSSEASGEIIMNTWNVLIGANEETTVQGRPDRSFNGLIDDVRVYGYALNHREVRELYESTKSGRTK